MSELETYVLVLALGKIALLILLLVDLIKGRLQKLRREKEFWQRHNRRMEIRRQYRKQRQNPPA